MAQVLIVATQVDVTGLDQPAGVAPDVADGVEFVSDTSAILAVNNASGGPVTATVVTPAKCPAASTSKIRPWWCQQAPSPISVCRQAQRTTRPPDCRR